MKTGVGMACCGDIKIPRLQTDNFCGRNGTRTPKGRACRTLRIPAPPSPSIQAGSMKFCIASSRTSMTRLPRPIGLLPRCGPT
jgi:hypothetical protein